MAELSHAASIMMHYSVNFYPAKVSGSPQTEVSKRITRTLGLCVPLSNTQAVEDLGQD